MFGTFTKMHLLFHTTTKKVLLFQKLIKQQLYHSYTQHIQNYHYTLKTTTTKKPVLSTYLLAAFLTSIFPIPSKAPVLCWVVLTPLLDSMMDLNCPTSTSHHPNHSVWFRDAHMTPIRSTIRKDSTPGLLLQERAVQAVDLQPFCWSEPEAESHGSCYQ